MSIASMTGFGRGEATANGVAATVEVSAVNRKQLDCVVSLPPYLGSLEPRVQTEMRRALSRGHVRAVITIAKDAADTTSDTSHWRVRIAALRAAAAAIGLPDDLTASTLLRLDSADPHDTKPDDAWAAIAPALAQALTELVAMRLREGAALRTDLLQRLITLKEIKALIAQRAPDVPRAYRDTLHARLTALLEGEAAAPEPDSLAREVALFADRCDISEELTRLDSHFDQANEMLNSSAPCGRPLDFLCQEFFREINTIGSKASDAAITRQVIAFKTGLEALREQVQNLE